MKAESIQSATRFTLGALSMGILVACGGGSVGDPGFADGGIRGTGSSVGPVSGFGSVFVNGIEFSTDDIENPVVTSDDGITHESELSEGMILRVEGQWRDNGQGTADSLSYDDTLRGPITELAADPSGAGEFVTVSVMGQDVEVNRQTVVRGTTFADLLNGTGVNENVRVSAWRESDGSYRAGYIAILDSTPATVELEGSVTDVNVAQNEFMIGNITVQYSDGVTFGPGLTEGDLLQASALEVEGWLTGSLLTANSIDRDDARRFARDGADDTQLTATIDTPYLSDGTSSRPGEFTMGGLTVRVTNNTELEDGLSLSDLRPDLLVQVEGRFLSDTVVEAEEIERREANAKVEGAIETNSVTRSPDQFVVGGVSVHMTPLTILIREDGDLQSFESLAPGTQVEVDGVEREDGSAVYIEALKVEVDDDQDGDDANEFELEGRLRFITQTPSANGLSILGVTMSDLGAEYKTDGEDENSARASIVEAFNASETVILEVEYSNISGFVAEEIELEDGDDD
jgi:uncharacterized protein DUF5666